MRKKIHLRTEYILEEKDINTIKECLNYCYHRLSKHKCGIAGIVNLDKVNRLRDEF